MLVTSAVAACCACGGDSRPAPHPHPLPTASPAQAASCGEGALDATGPASGGMVSTPDPEATAAGCRVLADGGTAADALVASQYVLGLTEPQYSGPGGGGLAVYHDGPSGITESFDGTVHAPEDAAARGSVGVPQTDRLMDTLRARFGTMDLGTLTEPARRLATDGFPVSRRLADAMSARRELFDHLPAAGDTMTNTDYADYLAGLQGTSDPLEPADPLCVPYQGYRVCGSHGTETGMAVVGETLGILDHLDLARLTPYSTGTAPVACATAQHLVMEAERLAFADANTWMADAAVDPDRARDYVRDLVTGSDHLADAADRITQRRTLHDPQPSSLAGRSADYSDSNDQGTSQITVRDSAGSTASLTTTLQRSFGSGEKEHGYFLNNSLDNFTADAEEGQPNRREPGAHPRTMMSPLLVFSDGADGADGADSAGSAGGAPVMALGSPGGRKIPSYVVKALVAMVDWDLTPAQAVRMPNFGAENRGAVYSVSEHGDGASDSDADTARRLLEGWGHELRPGSFDSGLSVLRVAGEQVSGAADARRDGAVAGVAPEGA